ncbi:hypothetical protein COBT_000326 [Conglomerata obtusa]
MNIFYTAIFIITNFLNARFVNKYTTEKVIERLTQFDATFEKKIGIRIRNRYNEIVAIKYKVLNELGHKFVYSIIKKYLDMYYCFCNKNVFSVATLKKEIIDQNMYTERILLDFMQKITRMYLHKNDKKKLEYNNIDVFKSDENYSNIKEKLSRSQIILIHNSLDEEDDFALFYMNLHYVYYNLTYKDYYYIFINLKFDSSVAKQEWLKSYPFKSFFSETELQNSIKSIEVLRQEVSLPHV